MVWRPSTAEEATDSPATVTVIAAGLSVEEIGRIARAFADVTVVPLAEALRAPLPAHAVIAARDSAQVAELLTRFGHSAAAPHFRYALPADPDPGLPQALGSFDVMSIEPRDEVLLFSLQPARALPGTASEWVRRLDSSAVRPKSDGDARPSGPADAGSRERVTDKAGGSRPAASPLPRSHRGAKNQPRSKLNRRTVSLVGGAVLVALIGACGLVAFRSPAGMILATLVGFLLAASTAGVLSVRQRLETVARRVQETATVFEHQEKPSKGIDTQLRSLRSAVSVNTSTVGSNTAAVNELVQRLGRAAPEDTPRAG